MSKEIKKYNVETSISEFQLVNPNFAKVLIKVAYADKNRNKSDIPKEAFDKATGTLPYTPIVGHYLEDKEIFGGHDSELIINDDSMEVKNLTIPYGVVSSEAPFWKSFKELDGTYKDYFCCYGYLWIGRYPELDSIKSGDYSQSMEISVNSATYSDDGYIVINDFTFDALCILQRDEPCFEGSKITTNFSKEGFEKDYKEMVGLLKQFALEEFNEGGNTMDEEILENEDFKKTEEEKDKKEQDPEMMNPDEMMPEDKKKKASDESESEEEHFEAETSELEEKYNKLLEEFNVISEELTEVKAKYVGLSSEHEQLKEDNKSLSEYKLNKEKAEKEVVYSAKLEEFSALEGIEKFAEIKEKMFDFTLEGLEKELKVIAYDNGISIKKKAKKEFGVEKPTQLPVDSKPQLNPMEDYAKARYGADIVKQYSLNNK